MTITAYTPLGSGLLTGKYHQNPELLKNKMFYWRARMKGKLEASRPLVTAMQEMAQKYQATAAQIALNWVIHFNGDSVVTIPGATKPSQAAESAAAMKFKLSAEELAKLDELSRQFR